MLARCSAFSASAMTSLTHSHTPPQVRDRATLYLKQLGGAAGGPAGLGHQLDISLLSLEKQLSEYLAGGATERAFDMV